MPSENSRPRCPACDSTTRGLYTRRGAEGRLTSRPLWECASCYRVTPANLNELRDLLLAGHVPEPDWTRLPTFGGTPLDGQHGSVWSWDEQHALVGSGTNDLRIVRRDEAEYLRPL